MASPDFALPGPSRFEPRDLLFIFEHFPGPAIDPVEAVRRLHEQPAMLESLLESGFLRDALLDTRHGCLQVSPRLFFNVMLRQAIPGPRTPEDRSAIHYVANLLDLFASTERVYRPQAGDDTAYEYVVDLVEESARASYTRRFLVDAHIGNYALFVSGMHADWVNHRLLYQRRLVSLEYYRRIGASYFASAANHPSSQDYGLSAVFRALSRRFEHFRAGLQRMAGQLGGDSRRLQLA